VHFVDGLVGQVLDDLKQQKLLDNLIVIIKSDHGMELDENGLGFSGHAGARHPPHIWNLR
jgi:membrane-anchored protein YejM (alkaline phosphatase superfamily)